MKLAIATQLFKFAALLCLCLGVWCWEATTAQAATLSVAPETGVYTTGSVFTIQVNVNTDGKKINAAEGTLSFDPSQLAVSTISKGSLFSLWPVEPSFNNTAGTVSFSGGTPSGYAGSGAVLSVTFRAIAAGTAKVALGKGSVLAADGQGTNVLTSMGSAAYTIAAAQVAPEPEIIEYVAPANTPAVPIIRSGTHPDPAAWYPAATAELSWTLPDDVVAVRTLLDDSSGSIPTKVYDPPIDHLSLSELAEGVQYFHLQFKNAEGWGAVAHYRLAVDTLKPASFTIELPPQADLADPEQTLLLKVDETTSPVRRYLVQLDGAEPYEFIDETGSSTLPLPPLPPGHHTVIIEAFDAAGNSLISTFSFDISAFDQPQFTDYPTKINEEVIPVFKGQTRPRSEVTVTIVQVGANGSQASYTVRADDAGVFTVIPETRFAQGVYELTAVAIDEHGARSAPSDPVRMAVAPPGFLKIGTLVVNVLSILVPLVGILLLLALMVTYFIRRLRVIRRTVVRETDEALAVLDREFAALRKTLAAQSATVAKSRKTKQMTKAETELVAALETALSASAARIKSEISDVDDVVS